MNVMPVTQGQLTSSYSFALSQKDRGHLLLCFRLTERCLRMVILFKMSVNKWLNHQHQVRKENSNIRDLLCETVSFAIIIKNIILFPAFSHELQFLSRVVSSVLFCLQCLCVYWESPHVMFMYDPFTAVTQPIDTTWRLTQSQEICTFLTLIPEEFIVQSHWREPKTWRKMLKWLQEQESSVSHLMKPDVGMEGRPWKPRLWVPKVLGVVNVRIYFYQKKRKSGKAG